MMTKPLTKKVNERLVREIIQDKFFEESMDKVQEKVK